MMFRHDYDLFVIGAGSGGVRACRMAAHYGARVAVAEERYVGGTCVNVGCVPKKLMWYASHMRDLFAEAGGYGWLVGPRDFDWPTFRANKNREIQRLNRIYDSLLEKAKVSRVDGHARITSRHTLDVRGREITAAAILVATGSWPRMPAIPGIEHAVTSNEVFYLDSLPGRLLLVGGGYIAVEFAGIFHGLGSRVTLSYRGDLFLRGFDDDIRQALYREMTAKDMDIRFQSRVVSIEREGDEKVAIFEDGRRETYDEIIFATGRRPMTDNLGLESVGIVPDEFGSIQVDAFCKTGVDSIYAIGDVIHRMELTPVAIAEGMAVARTLFQGQPVAPDYNSVPTAVFSQPPIGTVGLTEAKARKEGYRVRIYRSRFRPLKNTLSGSREEALFKLVVDDASDRVLGIHLLGADVPEMLQGFAVAMKHGVTKAQFDTTLGIHPTGAEELVTMREPD